VARVLAGSTLPTSRTSRSKEATRKRRRMASALPVTRGIGFASSTGAGKRSVEGGRGTLAAGVDGASSSSCWSGTAVSSGVFSLSTTGTTDISEIDDAINQVSAQRSTFGAVQNRLEHTANNLSVYQENLTASESQIRDVDMAAEMVKFTKDQILQQAGTSMLSQANQLPNSVLSLLR